MAGDFPNSYLYGVSFAAAVYSPTSLDPLLGGYCGRLREFIRPEVNRVFALFSEAVHIEGPLPESLFDGFGARFLAPWASFVVSSKSDF